MALKEICCRAGLLAWRRLGRVKWEPDIISGGCAWGRHRRTDSTTTMLRLRRDIIGHLDFFCYDRDSCSRFISVIMPSSPQRLCWTHPVSKYEHACNHPKATSSSFAAKLCCPLRVPLEIVAADSWSGSLDGFDKILDVQWRLQQLLRVNVYPSHFHGSFISR
jgi:hypothetical protein